MSDGVPDLEPPLPDEFKCPVCGSVLQDPCEAPCGHRACFLCFTVLEDGLVECPLDREQFQVGDVDCDRLCKQDLLEKSVRCPYAAAGCRWSRSLKYLQQHEQSCRFRSTDSPNTLGPWTGIQRDLEEYTRMSGKSVSLLLTARSLGVPSSSIRPLEQLYKHSRSDAVVQLHCAVQRSPSSGPLRSLRVFAFIHGKPQPKVLPSCVALCLHT